MAASTVAIRVDPSDVLKALDGIRNGVPRACTRAINRTLVTVRAEVARELSRETGLPVTLAKAATLVRNATFANLLGKLEVSGKRIPLFYFRARQTATGVRYTLPHGAGVLPHAFIATMPSGHRGVFMRRLPTRSRAGRPRSSPALPISERFGPSLPRAAAAEVITGKMRDVGGRALAENLLREIQYLVVHRKGA